jgi:two-component system, NtrC family, response regulator HydG
VLAIGAHPDDVEIGMGAALAKHRSAGDRLVIAIATSGAAGGVADIRQQEAHAAAIKLGAELMCGNLQDTCVPEGAPTIKWLTSIMSAIEPEIVYTHSVHDTHQDHRAVHRASLVATRNVPEVLCYQSPSSTPSFSPTRFLDVSDFFDIKQSVLAVYETQSGIRAYLAPDLIRSTARYWGRFGGYGLVEPFEVLRSRS